MASFSATAEAQVVLPTPPFPPTIMSFTSLPVMFTRPKRALLPSLTFQNLSLFLLQAYYNMNCGCGKGKSYALTCLTNDILECLTQFGKQNFSGVFNLCLLSLQPSFRLSVPYSSLVQCGTFLRNSDKGWWP